LLEIVMRCSETGQNWHCRWNREKREQHIEKGTGVSRNLRVTAPPTKGLTQFVGRLHIVQRWDDDMTGTSGKLHPNYRHSRQDFGGSVWAGEIATHYLVGGGKTRAPSARAEKEENISPITP